MSLPSSSELAFITTCPVEKCASNSDKHKWFHVFCGGTFKLTIEGNLTCDKCNKTSALTHWKFDCGNHTAEKASHQLIDGALNSLKKDNDSVITAFLAKAIPLIKDQKDNQEQETQDDDLLIAIESRLNAYTRGDSKKDRSKRVNLVTPCPVNDCPNRNKYYQWTHKTCNKPLKLYRDGTVECVECNQSRPFVKWNFKCEEHQHDATKATHLRMQDVLDVFELMGNSEPKQAFIKDLKECLTQQFEEQQKEIEEQEKEQKMKEQQE